MKLTPAEFDEIRLLIKQLCGIALSNEKVYLVKSRIGPILKKHGLRSCGELVTRCQSNQAPQMRNEIIEAITTKETSFYRDGYPFDDLVQHILPELVKAKQSLLPSSFRIWSAATSTGQEAYSLATAILQFVAHQNAATPINTSVPIRGPRIPNISSKQFSIIATDISQTAIETARRGVYSKLETDRGLTPIHREQYGVERDGQFYFDDSVKQMIQFQTQNLLLDFSRLGAFDLILCRNLLIYFDESTRAQVVHNLTSSLAPNGFLLFGSAENLVEQPTDLRSCNFGKSIWLRKSN